MKHYPQIDLIKGLAIISILLSHTFNSSILIAAFSHLLSIFMVTPLVTRLSISFDAQTISSTSPITSFFLIKSVLAFTINQAIPVFLVIMGLNSGLSFSQGRSEDINLYLIRRIRRLIFPFFVIFVISLIIGIYYKEYYIGWKSLFAVLPYSPQGGLGDWFVSLMIQYMLFAPIIYKLFKKSPRMLLISSFIINLIAQIMEIYFIKENAIAIFIYHRSILYGAFAIVLGMYLHKDLLKNGYIDFNDKNKFILFGALISILFIFISPYNFIPGWNHWGPLTFFYPAVLISLILNSSWNITILSKIGSASYHIFLIQTLYFGCNFSFSKYVNEFNLLYVAPISIILDILIPMFIGILFETIDKRIDFKAIYYRNRLNKLILIR